MHSACGKCSPRFAIGTPGSFIHPWLHNLSHLPREVLIYEILLRITNLEKANNAIPT